MTPRRQFLLGLVPAFLALVGFRRPVGASLPLGRRLADIFAQPIDAVGMGRAVIRSGVAVGLDRQGLQCRLIDACRTTKSLDLADDDALRRAVRAVVAEDFAAERTVAVEGWRLAEAEVAIYRIVAEDAGAIT
jgi:hypothetical protein